MITADGTAVYPWNHGETLTAAALNAAIANATTAGGSASGAVNVLDNGAKGDGVTDDTTAIQSTLNTYAGNAIVFVPNTGNPYVVTGLTLPSNTDLILDGTLQMKTGTNIGGAGVVGISNQSNIIIRGYGTIDGNDPSLTSHSVSAGLSADQTTNLRVSGITLRGAHYWNINITRSQNVVLTGVHSTGGGNANEFANACDNCWLMNCTIENITPDFGFSFYGGVTNSGAIGNTIRNCNVGIFVLSDSGQSAVCRNILIEGNIIYNSYVSAIAADLSVAGYHEAITITGNRVYDNNTSNQTAQAHIMIGAVQSVTVNDNMISGLDPVNSCAYGIRLKGPTDAVVTGNNIFNIGQASEPGYGVWIDSAGYVLVQGNNFHDYRGTPYMAGIGGAAGAVNRFTNNLFGTLTAQSTITPQPDTIIDVPALQIVVPPNGNIQARINQLPATGGKIVLSPNTTYVVTTTINVTTPNVTIEAPSWNTVVQRGASFTTGPVIAAQTSAPDFVCQNFTIDGNSVVQTSYFDLQVGGDNSLVRHMQMLNSAGDGSIALSGNNSRATGNRVIGRGVDPGTERGSGIWAVNHQTVMIDHNTVNGMGIDGIEVDGNGSQVIGNTVWGNHLYAGNPGGQIVTYPLSSNPNGGRGVCIVGNTVRGGGASNEHGIEVGGVDVLVTGNVVDSVEGYGILVISSGVTITGNLLRNISTGPNTDGIEVLANVGNFVISGNQIIDERATTNMRAGIWVVTGSADNYTISGNTIIGATFQPLVDGGTGHHKSILANAGVDSIVPQIVLSATLQLPPNPTVIVLGTTTVTAMNITNDATGRTCVLMPQSAFSFTAGATIANSFTATAQVPILGVFDGVQWHFR